MEWIRRILGFIIAVALFIILIDELLHFSRDTLVANLMIVILAILGIIFVGLGIAGKIKRT